MKSEVTVKDAPKSELTDDVAKMLQMSLSDILDYVNGLDVVEKSNMLMLAAMGETKLKELMVQAVKVKNLAGLKMVAVAYIVSKLQKEEAK